MDQPNDFNNQYKSVRYLDQGWLPADSMRFYGTTLGSDLIPYDFFMSLEQRGTSKLFRSDDNLYFYGYLPQTATRSNPDGLPVGFVRDVYLGKNYLGFTCAACHTGQVNYKGVAMRIDGGPAGSDLDSFLQKLAEVMRDTQENETARAQFVKRVLDRGNYASADAVEKDLVNFTGRLSMYVLVNRSPTRYGYYRLDAFGRIYNRVLEHLVTQDQLNAGVRDMVRDGDLTQAKLDAILNYNHGDNVLTGKQRDHLVFRLAQMLTLKEQVQLSKKIFNTPEAPVSYPYLWDTPQHDFVQWNGMASNADPHSIKRSIGEMIGAFATLDWRQELEGPLSSGKPNLNFQSSVRVENLRHLEHYLESLQSPQWPQDILPPIDFGRSSRGEKLFSNYCAGCHTNINRADPKRRIVASMTRLEEIGTDSKMATNAVKYDGLSGMLRNEYTPSGGGPILIGERAPAAALLTKATLNMVDAPNPSNIRRGLNWLDEFTRKQLADGNDIKFSIKQGSFNPDTAAKPYASLLSYKARSLNGIWATAPYLHNGSVPTLYDLLLPQNPEDAKDPIKAAPCVPNPEYRPCKFMVGSREFDPEKVGLQSSGYDGFSFNVRLPGNSNGGHEFGTKVLSKEDRLDLLEYLKTL